eukprot:scaffold9585_cov68-Attheya_sp.AAC.1
MGKEYTIGCLQITENITQDDIAAYRYDLCTNGTIKKTNPMKKHGNFGKKHYVRQYAWKQANYTGH